MLIAFMEERLFPLVVDNYNVIDHYFIYHKT